MSEELKPGDYVEVVGTPFRGKVLFVHRKDKPKGGLKQVRLEMMKGSVVIGQRWWYDRDKLKKELP